MRIRCTEDEIASVPDCVRLLAMNDSPRYDSRARHKIRRSIFGNVRWFRLVIGELHRGCAFGKPYAKQNGRAGEVSSIIAHINTLKSASQGRAFIILKSITN